MRVIVDFPAAEGRGPLGFARPRAVLAAHRPEQVAPVLDAAQQAAAQGAWVVGMVAYEAAAAFDKALQVRPAMADLPLAVFAVYDEPSALTEIGGDFNCGSWVMEIDRRRFDADLAALQADILAGRFYQTNHTSRLRADFSGDAEALFRSLQTAQPGGYGFYMEDAAWQVLSVSPELFFDWRGDGVLT
ncbi:MAG: bifunctional aminodeoxychorismate synthase component I/aminotransferase, partial [Rhodocyclaceae bacterium]